MEKRMSIFILAVVCILLLFSCQVQKEVSAQEAEKANVPTWEEFYAANVVESDVEGEKHYLIEGDLYTSHLSDVRSYYDYMVKSLDTTTTQRATVHLNNGSYDIYNSTTRYNLTYTIDSAIPTDTRNDLTWALNEWETYAGVDFIDVTGTGTTPLFVLRNATAAEESANPSVIASAFFPSFTDKELILYDNLHSYRNFLPL
ncbi:MAG: hypothetical protein MJB14_12710 [Spirochaetes bacterium]|nr:hypothetical protein [Spirochaetota bacterium]